MGFRFQRRIKVLRGISVNVSKSGVGVSVGGRGFHTGIDSKGRRYTSASLPGTGLSWREYRKPSGGPPRSRLAIGIVVAFVIVVALIIMAGMLHSVR
jgi:hypothetical protein